MKPEPFVINNRFYIYPALNRFKDIRTGEERRIEPRIMAVLCHLASPPGELVTREQLVTDIWNDYGGGDEALSQVISFIRKLLNDPDKQLIRTIPKKGYQLSGTITRPALSEPQKSNFISRPGLKTISQVAGLLYVVITAVYFAWSGFTGDKEDSVKHEYMAVKLPKPDAFAHRRFQSKKAIAKPAAQQPVGFASIYARSTRSIKNQAINNNIYAEASPVQNVDEPDDNEGPQVSPLPQPDPIVRTHIHIHTRVHIHKRIHTVIDSVHEIKVVTKVKSNLEA